MSDEKPYDQDDEHKELIPIVLPYPPTENNIYELVRYMTDADRRDEVINQTVRDYLDELFDEFGEDCVVPILSYVQLEMGWDLEILMDKRDTEDALMKNHSIFDDEIWRKVLNTRAVNEFHHAVYRLSQTYLNDAIAEVLMKEELRTPPEGDLPN
jgi:hypothetical protein